LAAVIADRLGRRQDMVFVEGISERRAAMARGAEGDALRGISGVRFACEIGRNQPWDVGECTGGDRLACGGIGVGHRFLQFLAFGVLETSPSWRPVRMRGLPGDGHNESIDNRPGRIPFPFPLGRDQAGWKRWCARASSMMDLCVPLETTKALDWISSIRAMSPAAASTDSVETPVSTPMVLRKWTRSSVARLPTDAMLVGVMIPPPIAPSPTAITKGIPAR